MGSYIYIYIITNYLFVFISEKSNIYSIYIYMCEKLLVPMVF